MTLPYKEGDLFAVPLRDGGYAIGLVARMSKQGKVLFGYFFGPRRDSVPELGDLEIFSRENSLAAFRFGDLSLIQGEWTIIGQLPGWNRRDWPMTAYVRRDVLIERAWRIEYSEDNPAEEISMQPLENGGEQLEEDGLYGAGAVEIVLTKLLE